MIHIFFLFFFFFFSAALESVICLVERDCDTTVGDSNSFLAAHLAARYDKLDCLRFLVQQGTALDAAQSEGRTPAHVVSCGPCLFYFLHSVRSFRLLVHLMRL